MIPCIDFGGDGPALHFLHANGYPPECYRPLITRLTERYHVFSMRQRPLWPDSKPEEIADWHPLTDDFLQFLDEHPTGASIAIGHSLGGIVALRAALRQPERFRALVLIDPVLFPPPMVAFIRLIQVLGLSYRLNPYIPEALRRRRIFENRASLTEGYRRKSVFRYLSNPNLEDCVDGLTRPRPDGKYELLYSPEWEAHIYATGIWHDMDLWRALPNLNIPFLIIRGAETETFWNSTARRVLQKVPATRVVTIPQATHLVPLEWPDEVNRAIQEFLQENL